MLKFHYRPLPPGLKLMPSNIEGMGVHAAEYLVEGTSLGITHIKDDSHAPVFSAGIIRTPLGGFINHSESPNCLILTSDKYWTLWTTKDIRINEELTVDYRIYPCGYNTISND